MSLGAVLLLADFAVWAGYNILYPQILLPRTQRSEIRILDLLTEPEEEVVACDIPVSSLDLMDLELIPKENCFAIIYPSFYEAWGDKMMMSVEERPHVVLYDPAERSAGKVYEEYARDFDAYIREHYVHLSQAENIWISDSFAGEALNRLKEAGYGNRIAPAVDHPELSYPREYVASQSIRQTFIAEGTNLTAVRFRAACFHRRSSPTLSLRLTDGETGTLIAEETMTADLIADDFFSRSPLKAKTEPGKQYELEVYVEKIEGKGDMEFYLTEAGELSLVLEYAE